MEVGCERGQPRPRLWLKQLRPHSQQIAGNIGIDRLWCHLCPHKNLSVPPLLEESWQLEAMAPPRAGCCPRGGGGVGIFLRAFIQ